MGLGMVAGHRCAASIIGGNLSEAKYAAASFSHFLTNYLKVMTLNPVCENVETAQGVPLTVTGVAQVKIMKNADLLQTASEQFLGKKEHEIKSTVLQTLEGHLRAILGEFPIVDSCRAGNLLSDEVFRNRMEREREHLHPSLCTG